MALPDFISNTNLGLLAEFDLGLLLMEVLLFGASLFLIMLILVQRGKGGGLAGALGGAGGQSAFGAKAGDAFTKITVVTAVFWIMLCMVTIAYFNPPPKAKTVVNSNLEVTGEDSVDEEAAAINALDDNTFVPTESGSDPDATTDTPASSDVVPDTTDSEADKN